jgi:hypothetical protein
VRALASAITLDHLAYLQLANINDRSLVRQRNHSTLDDPLTAMNPWITMQQQEASQPSGPLPAISIPNMPMVAPAGGQVIVPADDDAVKSVRDAVNAAKAIAFTPGANPEHLYLAFSAGTTNHLPSTPRTNMRCRHISASFGSH